MFKIALTIVATLISVSAFAAERPFHCENLAILQPNDEGQAQPVKSGIRIDVYESENGLRGWVADATQYDEKYNEKDVEVTVTNKEALDDYLGVMLETDPTLNSDDIASVRIANIGVEANQSDAYGAYLFELLGKDGQLLRTFGQYGWGFGICVQ